MTPLTLEQQLDQALRQLESYRDLDTDQADDPSFIARGNGFCDSKYSQDFIDMQIAQLTARVADLQNRIKHSHHDI
ncbi:MAG: hypothetical protein IJU19_08015 [Bacteroidales bacterium]|nr:hypothetical protein [Bacteroidales bacterium]